MPTRIDLVRHGATILTEEDRFAGSSDVPLSDEDSESSGHGDSSARKYWKT
jgi:probable phosphoglycerate mutase